MMHYEHSAIQPGDVPAAVTPVFQHAVDTYASETNKVHSIWTLFNDADLAYRPHPKSSSVGEILKHQLLSERRFFGEFLGLPELAASEILPAETTVTAHANRLVELARPRLGYLATQPETWWLGEARFFDVERERAWIFWRRILHTAHHRTQLTVYLRMLNKPVPSTYGPTADVTWTGADPTLTVR